MESGLEFGFDEGRFAVGLVGVVAEDEVEDLVAVGVKLNIWCVR